MVFIGLMPWLVLVILLAGIWLRLRMSPAHHDALGKVIVVSACIWGAYLAAVTEVLSLAGNLRFEWVLAAWLVAGAAVVVVLMHALRQRRARRHVIPSWAIWGWPVLGRVIPLGVVIVAALTGVVAVLAPPMTWDAMTYHMPRVMHWIQDGCLTHYPTANTRQLFMPPFAEYVVLHTRILAGDDRLANLGQYMTMLGCIGLAPTIAGQLGARRAGRALSTVLVATIPMGIAQASSAKNDYVLAFWIACVAYLCLRFVRGKWDWRTVVLVGCAVGLAMLTKFTAVIYAGPLMLWSGVTVLRGIGSRRSGNSRGKGLGATVAAVVVAAALAMAINSGHAYRNWMATGSVVGYTPGGVDKGVNTVFGPRATLSNLARNMALHIQAPGKGLRGALEAPFYWLHWVIGMDINDPRTTMADTSFEIRRIALNEDESACGIHVLLAMACWAIMFLKRSRRTSGGSIRLQYGMMLLACAIVFSTVLKWQPWHSRFHLAFFVMAAPWCGAVLGGLLRSKTLGALGVVLLAASMPWALACKNRSFVTSPNVLTTSRDELRFAANPHVRPDYVEAAGRLHRIGAKRVALVLDENDGEYLWWTLLDAQCNSIRIESIATGMSLPYPAGAFTPDVIVCTDMAALEELEVSGKFIRVWQSSKVILLSPRGS